MFWTLELVMESNKYLYLIRFNILELFTDTAEDTVQFLDPGYLWLIINAYRVLNYANPQLCVNLREKFTQKHHLSLRVFSATHKTIQKEPVAPSQLEA